MKIRLPMAGLLLLTVSGLSVSLLCVVLSAGIPAETNSKLLERPVMLDSDGPGSQLFVLDASGRLHKFRVADKSLEEYGTVTLPGQLVPADMAYALVGSQESVVIAGTEAGRGVVGRYSLDGRLLRTWKFRNICSGIDVSLKNHSAYVATSDSNQIYRVNLEDTSNTLVTRIDDAVKLGPLAFDEVRGDIYVADVATGKVYRYSTSTKIGKVFVTGLSAPTALAFDPKVRRLYIADPGRRGIFTVDAHAAKPVADVLASDPLKSPYGITLISDDREAVADYAANSVAVLSNKGELLFRFP